MIVVSNATPLINFAAIGRFDLLHALFGGVAIPEAVYQEVVAEGTGRPGAGEVVGASWIARRAVTDQPAVRALITAIRLGEGESEAIVLATELSATYVILDDLAARRYALTQGLPVIGTVGVLLLAKQKGLTPSVKEPMDALLAAGKYIDSTLYAEGLRRAGE